MAYTKTDWINDVTALSAENLDKMDTQIENLSSNTEDMSETINQHDEAIKDLTLEMAETNKVLEDHENRLTANDEICHRLENEAADNFDHVDVEGNTLTFWANGVVVEKVDFLVKSEDDVLIFPGKDGREIELQRKGGAIQWHYKDEVQWKTLVMLEELKGEMGKTPNITIGTITTVEWDEGAYVENIGTNENPIFNFHIPRGKPGEPGTGGGGGDTGEQVKEGYTFTPSVSPEGIISWTNNGELENPQPVNIRGPQGLPGRDGRDGVSGTSGKDGVAATIKIGTVSTVDINQGATVENVGTAANAIFNFKIPRGPQGLQGPKGNDAELPENMLTTENVTWAIIKDKPKLTSDRLSFVINNKNIILTNNFYQHLDLKENVSIQLPLNKSKNVIFEIHLFINVTETFDVNFVDDIKWKDRPTFEPNTIVECIFKNVNLKWVGTSEIYK